MTTTRVKIIEDKMNGNKITKRDRRDDMNTTRQNLRTCCKGGENRIDKTKTAELPTKNEELKVVTKSRLSSFTNLSRYE